MIGATEIALAIKMRREIKGEWFLILMGLASIIFAGLLLWNPLAGAAALIWIIAWYAVIMGVLAIIFGFRLRSLADTGNPLISGKRLQSYHPKRRTVLRVVEAVSSGSQTFCATKPNGGGFIEKNAAWSD